MLVLPAAHGAHNPSTRTRGGSQTYRPSRGPEVQTMSSRSLYDLSPEVYLMSVDEMSVHPVVQTTTVVMETRGVFPSMHIHVWARTTSGP